MKWIYITHKYYLNTMKTLYGFFALAALYFLLAINMTMGHLKNSTDIDLLERYSMLVQQADKRLHQ